MSKIRQHIAKIPILLMLLLPGPAGAAEPGIPPEADRLVPHSFEDYIEAMLSGGVGQDGIPSIDNPRFWSIEEADSFLDDGDIVFGVYRNGTARAYPQRILVWHEIVNDSIQGSKVSVTYCPLTGTAIGFEPGDTEIGVSGRLINSNLVMYDRATESYWPQILAAAINGPRQGQTLAEFRVIWTTWARWKSRHPETQVLSRRTGHARNYQRDP